MLCCLSQVKNMFCLFLCCLLQLQFHCCVCCCCLALLTVTLPIQGRRRRRRRRKFSAVNNHNHKLFCSHCLFFCLLLTQRRNQGNASVVNFLSFVCILQEICGIYSDILLLGESRNSMITVYVLFMYI